MAKKGLPTVILLDSCTYFRLGRSFRPMLTRLDGDPEYVLKVIAELDREFAKNPRLQTKFWWARGAEHAEERASNRYTPSGRKAKDADIAFSFISQHVKDEHIQLSLVDMRVLSAGYACKGIVVTDDKAMQSVADMFGIRWRNSLGLIQLMYERERATLDDVDGLIDYWREFDDMPTSMLNIKKWPSSL